jgi:UDP-N-acetylglucosamine--N-acetylmuramyl-(pentapeptide) pyrophosphoryl-undecaprenol N-acetylglucosamine transferase
LKVLFAGGGTGGHLYPALAVAQHLRATRSDFQAHFLGSAQGLEAKLVPAHGFPLTLIPGSGFRRLGLAGRVRAIVGLLRGLAAALAVLRHEHPDVVLATGGYASLAAGLAAAILRRPLVVQEQNSIPGFTNRLLGRLAREVHVAFPAAAARFRAAHVHCSGNPLRPELLLPAVAPADLPPDVPRVLVVGGSRGARSINAAVGGAIPILAATRRIVWVWQTGELDHAAIAPRWQAEPDVHVHAYLHDMAAMLQSATLVVCRAGAMTIAELAALGKVAILIPFPGAVDDHQTANARVLADAGAAVLLPDRDATGERLAREVAALLDDPARLAAMSARSRGEARPRATEELAAALIRVAGAGG